MIPGARAQLCRTVLLISLSNDVREQGRGRAQRLRSALTKRAAFFSTAGAATALSSTLCSAASVVVVVSSTVPLALSLAIHCSPAIVAMRSVWPGSTEPCRCSRAKASSPPHSQKSSAGPKAVAGS